LTLGSDTVLVNLAWLLGLLAKHPEIQEEAYEDLIRIHGRESWGNSMKEDVPYIVALIKETLRYFTVGRLTSPRKAVQDITVDDSTIIPMGSIVFLNAWAVDRGNPRSKHISFLDSEPFKEPSKFKPRRYLDTALASTSIARVAFVAGSRDCIGNHLANRELYVVSCRLLWSFKFFPAEDYDIDPLMGVAEPNALVVYPRGYKVIPLGELN
jgi:3-hydroxyphenylacetate 6-hydroxylase